MPRGGRHRRGSRTTEPAAAPAAQPTPLGDVSNSRPRAATALPPLKAAAASPAPPAVAPPPPPLPGLEADGLPAEPCGRLPVTAETFEAFGDALGCLRITSLARSASARRRSLLRLVQQLDEAEGRRSHSLPPEARPLLHAPTQALPDGSTATRPRGRRRSSGAGGRVQHERSREVACAALLDGSRYDSSEQPLPAPDAASNGACGDMPAPTLAAAATAGGSSGPDAVTAPSTQPPPLPVLPGGVAGGAGSAAAEAAAGEEAEGQQQQQLLQQRKEQVVGSERAAAEQLCRGEAVFCGLSAAEEAAALPSEAPPPAWLRQQGCTNVTAERVEPCPALSVPAQEAAAVWRAQWISGLQWHNAVRAGAPLRSGSKLLYIPLDPNEPVLEVLMFRAAAMPQHVVAGAARFQDIVLSEPELHSQAVEEGVLRSGLWAFPCGSGTYTLVVGGRQLALPLSFRRASPELLALFLACVWTESNSHEAAQAVAYSFGAGGERAMDESLLKYPASELHEWLHLAAGGQRPVAVTAALAALRRIAVFGTE